jgi:hypothetical protein
VFVTVFLKIAGLVAGNATDNKKANPKVGFFAEAVVLTA